MRYKKTYRKIGISVNSRERLTELQKSKKYIYISNYIFFVGIIIIGFVFFQVRPLNYISQNNIDIVKPFSGSVLGFVYSATNKPFSFEELSQKSISIIRPTNIPKNFSISIPKLNIDNANVLIDDTSLNPDEFLGHYVGTALPGESGNSFIYGHSSLPFFYNPKDYKTIFTKIPDLKNGDKVYIKINDSKLTYVVKLGRELLPKEIDPYINYYPVGFNKSTVTLMTCTPPGTKNYRYIVVAELDKTIQIEEQVELK